MCSVSVCVSETLRRPHTVRVPSCPSGHVPEVDVSCINTTVVKNVQVDIENLYAVLWQFDWFLRRLRPTLGARGLKERRSSRYNVLVHHERLLFFSDEDFDVVCETQSIMIISSQPQTCRRISCCERLPGLLCRRRTILAASHLVSCCGMSMRTSQHVRTMKIYISFCDKLSRDHAILKLMQHVIAHVILRDEDDTVK